MSESLENVPLEIVRISSIVQCFIGPSVIFRLFKMQFLVHLSLHLTVFILQWEKEPSFHPTLYHIYLYQMTNFWTSPNSKHLQTTNQMLAK